MSGSVALSSLPPFSCMPPPPPLPSSVHDETYVKKTPREHVLLRPDMYVGGVDPYKQEIWVCPSLAPPHLVKKQIQYSPALYKIFDEILVNAADNAQRKASQKQAMTFIEIEADAESISVKNDGQPIPIVMHSVHQVYIPELIFGHMLTSSNYDDSIKKTTGGRNGYGAKLANVFSKRFTIDLCDGERTYQQTFSDNMQTISPPTIKELPESKKHKKTWTLVKFWPELERFHTPVMDEDFVALLRRRACDIAFITKTRVLFNGSRIPVKDIREYASLFYVSNTCLAAPNKKEDDSSSVASAETSSSSTTITTTKAASSPFLYTKIDDRWEFCIGWSPNSTIGGIPKSKKFQHMAFVNGIWTVHGGSHVRVVKDAVMESVKAKFTTSATEANWAGLRSHLEDHLFLIVNCLVDNPAFDAQTKTSLTTRLVREKELAAFKPELFARKFAKHPIFENLKSTLASQELKVLKKSDGAKRKNIFIPKLDDANHAGGRQSQKCTLILTEGDSAKALAVAGLSVIGRDYWGVFPLRGKLINCNGKSADTITKNAEISNLKNILGLKHSCTYETDEEFKTLRYGRVMIMADQDQDGSHIKGLVINFFHHAWPALLKRNPPFLVEFITPIVKASSASAKKEFFTLPEYKKWAEECGSRQQQRRWNIKYYKGLGTSNPQEAKEYFSNLPKHMLSFKYQDTGDDHAIQLAFGENNSNQRKEWLLNTYHPDVFLDHASSSVVRYKDFVNKELILFSMSDAVRSIPSAVDGLKPCQRKILYACFKRNLTKEVKVAQLSGYVAEHTAYHHGEQSLQSAIIKMAQDFVGANNVPLLVPSGMFGTRLSGGKDSASARYTFTFLQPYTRKLFPACDDVLLDYLEEDSQSIEPSWYLPILPTVLLNSSNGIGTGWSSSVPPFHPRDIVDNLRRWRSGQPMVEMLPWFRGFKGRVSAVTPTKFATEGCISIVSSSAATVEITELPVEMWTETYKKMLQIATGQMILAPPSSSSKTKSPKEPTLKFAFPILSFTEHHNEASVHFKVQLEASVLQDILDGKFEKKQKPKKTPAKQANLKPKEETEPGCSVATFNSESKKTDTEHNDEDDGEMDCDFPTAAAAAAASSPTHVFEPGNTANLPQQYLLHAFHLVSYIQTGNMMLFDANNKIKKYHPFDIISEHGALRRDFYVRRKVGVFGFKKV